VRSPDPRLSAKYANRQSEQVESLYSVGSTPTLATGTVPSSNGSDTWLTSRRRWFDSIRDYWSEGTPPRRWCLAALQRQRTGFDPWRRCLVLLGLQVLWRHTAVVRRQAGFKSRADLLAGLLGLLTGQARALQA
jgi:hypothetical protein